MQETLTGRLVRFYHQLSSPRWFYEISGRVLPGLLGTALLVLLVAWGWGLLWAPPDARQGNSYRIIYLHVPISVLALAGYYVMAIAGAIGLVWRMKMALWTSRAAAPVGAVFTLISLLSGAVWGKPTWGTWWVWDARITSMLILLFLYLGVLILQRAYPHEESGNRAGAILAVVGTVNIPIIYKSVEWWNTLHQGATLKFFGESSMHPSMLHPLILAIIGMYLFYAGLLVLYLRADIIRHESRSQWVRDLVVR